MQIHTLIFIKSIKVRHWYSSVLTTSNEFRYVPRVFFRIALGPCAGLYEQDLILFYCKMHFDLCCCSIAKIENPPNYLMSFQALILRLNFQLPFEGQPARLQLSCFQNYTLLLSGQIFIRRSIISKKKSFLHKITNKQAQFESTRQQRNDEISFQYFF